MAYVHPVYHGGKNQPEQVTDEYLGCSLCKLPGAKLPKMLLCGHSFCLPCLQQYAGNASMFPCPSCSVLNKVPARGLAALSNNIFVDTQVDRLLRRHNQERGRDDSVYNISCYNQRPDIHCLCGHAACGQATFNHM